MSAANIAGAGKSLTFVVKRCPMLFDDIRIVS